MKYRVRHLTRYHYSEVVSLSHSLLACEPRSTSWQTCLHHETSIVPTPQYWEKRRDGQGNWIGYFSLEERHQSLTVVCRSLVEVSPRPELRADPAWEEVAAQLRHDPLASRFLYPSALIEPDPECHAYAALSFAPGRSLRLVFQELVSRIHGDFAYVPGSTAVHTPLSQVFAQRRGVCQDFAHVLIACLRSHGLAARYVSGYLLTQPPPGQPRLVGADASHAWAACWFPGDLWLEGDPTNDCLCTEQHIVLAWGRDYQEVAPLRGVVLGGGQQQIEVSVDVTPQGEA